MDSIRWKGTNKNNGQPLVSPFELQIQSLVHASLHKPPDMSIEVNVKASQLHAPGRSEECPLTRLDEPD